MYVLWARKEDKPNFEFITEFNNVEQKYYLIDTLEGYKEAIVVSESGCELYVEFPKPKIFKRG